MRFLKIILLALLFVSVISCSKDDDEQVQEITIADFVGSWIATSATFTNNSNTSEKFNFIANGGEIRFTMLNGGGVRTWISIGTFSDEWDAQAKLTDSNTMVTTPVEAARGVNRHKYILNGNTLTLTNESDKFDFTLMDAAEVPATSVIVFQKN